MESDALAIAAGLARKFEGCYLKPYLCPAGVPTIGYGSTFYEDGVRVTLQDSAITKDRAEQLLQWELRRCLLKVTRLCPGADSSKRLSALVDFCFNLGAGNLKASTLRRRVNQRDWAGAVLEINKWVKGGGKVLKGLVARRKAESLLLY